MKMKEFKAGDFTSGKMGEIFKECFFRDVVVINHKQFGKAYMMPDDLVKAMVFNILEKRPTFVEFVSTGDNTITDFFLLEDEKQLSVVSSYFTDDFHGCWFEVLTVL
jgi:hypothetical protein